MIYSAPSYLKDLVIETGEQLLNKIKEEYGENVTSFKFNKKFRKLIRNWLEEYDEFGSTIYGINIDNEKINIFDPSENGYEGLMGLCEQENLNTLKPVDLENETEIIIAFQYSGDEEEVLEDGYGRSQSLEDYFGWVAVYKNNNGTLEEIINIECA